MHGEWVGGRAKGLEAGPVHEIAGSEEGVVEAGLAGDEEAGLGVNGEDAGIRDEDELDGVGDDDVAVEGVGDSDVTVGAGAEFECAEKVPLPAIQLLIDEDVCGAV